jgi:hypothetical protein
VLLDGRQPHLCNVCVTGTAGVGTWCCARKQHGFLRVQCSLCAKVSVDRFPLAACPFASSGDNKFVGCIEFDTTPIEEWADVRPSDDSMYMNHSCDPTCTSFGCVLHIAGLSARAGAIFVLFTSIGCTCRRLVCVSGPKSDGIVSFHGCHSRHSPGRGDYVWCGEWLL